MSSSEEIPTPLREQDTVIYVTDLFQSSRVTGEILELDIPHPHYDLDKGVWIRVERVNSQNHRVQDIIQRGHIFGVLCPNCQNFLVGLRKKTTHVDTNSSTRLYRYCNSCKYFKEAL